MPGDPWVNNRVRHDAALRPQDRPRPQGRVTQLATTLREFPGLRILSPAAADSLQADRQQDNAEVDYLAMGLVLAFTAIAVVTTLAMSVAARVREFALLRLAG